MDSDEDTASFATAIQEIDEKTQMQPNLGMKLLVFVVVLLGAFLIIDLLRAYMRF